MGRFARLLAARGCNSGFRTIKGTQTIDGGYNRAMGDTSFFTRYVAALALSACLAFCAGCQTPERQARQAERDRNILKLVEQYRVGEQVRPSNLNEDWQLIEEQRLEHVKRLDATLLLIEETHLEEQRRWMELAPTRQEQIHSIFSGRSEKIERTWRWLGS